MKNKKPILITETPRDALQGLKKYIPAATKAEYINLLLKCGFDCVDVGSFVSYKSVPQMTDTDQVLDLLEDSDTEIMVVVGNEKGCLQAVEQARVGKIGFPYSVSPTFLMRNINSTPEKASVTIDKLLEITHRYRKNLLVYMAMAFGNPYGDKWSIAILLAETEKLYCKGLREIALSDITAEATPDRAFKVCDALQKAYPDVHFRVHLHTLPGESHEKINAAYEAGIRNFESATGGAGGCPMTGYEMVSNLNTFDLLNYCKINGIETSVDEFVFGQAMELADKIFAQYS